MKKVWKTATYIAVLLVSLSIYSCGNDEDETKGSVDDLIGVWQGVTEDEWVVEEGEREENYGKDISNERYEFKSDMTFNLLEKQNNTWRVSENGKWKLEKNKVILTFYYPNDGGYDEEEPEIMTILECSCSTLVWEYHWKEPGFELYAKQSLRKINE